MIDSLQPEILSSNPSTTKNNNKPTKNNGVEYYITGVVGFFYFGALCYSPV
jgi:hypothetical protein